MRQCKPARKGRAELSLSGDFRVNFNFTLTTDYIPLSLDAPKARLNWGSLHNLILFFLKKKDKKFPEGNIELKVFKEIIL